MNKKGRYTLIGLFVVSAIALALGALVLVGGGLMSKDAASYVMYFDGSVKGLRVGATVDFRGVRVGEVSTIAVRYFSEDDTFRIPVTVEIDPARIEEISGRGAANADSTLLEELIRKGLRGQLSFESFVTGQLAIQLDFVPDKPAIFRGLKDSHPEIPTLPSTIDALSEQLAELPLDEMARNFSDVLAGVDAFLDSGSLQNLMDRAGKAVEAAEALARTLRVEAPRLSTAGVKAVDEVTLTLGQFKKTLREFESLTSSENPAQAELLETVRSMKRASRSAAILFETLEQQPESLLRGKSKND